MRVKLSFRPRSSAWRLKLNVLDIKLKTKHEKQQVGQKQLNMLNGNILQTEYAQAYVNH